MGRDAPGGRTGGLGPPERAGGSAGARRGGAQRGGGGLSEAADERGGRDHDDEDGRAEPLPTGIAALLRDRRVQVVGGALVLILLLAIGGALRRGQSEEDRIRRVLDAIEEAVEAREVGDALEHVSLAYRDPDGTTRDAVKLLLVHTFMTGRSLHVQRVGDTEVEILPDGAGVARFTAVLSEGDAIAAIGNADRFDFEVRFANEEGDWRVTSHTRKQR